MLKLWRKEKNGKGVLILVYLKKYKLVSYINKINVTHGTARTE